MNRLRIVAFVGGVIFFIAVYFWILSDLRFDVFDKFIDASVNTISDVLKGITWYFLSKYNQHKWNNIFNRIIIFCGFVFVVSFLRDLVMYHFIINEEYIKFINQTEKLRTFFGIIVFVFSAYFLDRLNEKANTQNEQDYLIENEKLLKESELLSLRQQLQPHFLFNSLNSISALLTLNPSKAQNMLQELSDFLRDTLRKENNQLLSLEIEISHLQKYLNIEMIRFEQRLKVEIDIDNAVKEMLLPALILQPIVENAIKFGLYGTSDEVLIKIEAKAKNNMLLIEVFNPFDTDTNTQNKGEGFGLMSISRRLSLLYSRNDLLKTKTEGNTFISQILIPQNKA